MTDQNEAMYKLIALTTAVGGHFLNGKRARGYGYLVGFIAWPFFVVVVQIAVLILGYEQALTPTVVSATFALGFAGFWIVSVRQAMADRRTQPVHHAKIRTWEITLVSITVYSVALYGFIGLVLTPRLHRGEGIELFQVSSSRSHIAPRLLPTELGDLVLIGKVSRDGKALGNAQLMLIFQEGFRTPEIKTDSAGVFEYRLPPGNWHFAGPLVAGLESRSVYVVFSPEIVKPEFQVNPGLPTRNMRMKVVIE